ncbi:MAG TPA: ABC transporter permease [Thermoanaerobaculia bacterium]|nr:ABC transporter permease [Thermoanaerobaculia bacterium]
MIRHLLKLVWNRKRANALIVAEIFVSFLVIFAVLTGSITFISNWMHPLGYNWHDVWNVRADIELESHPENDPRVRETLFRLLQEARSLPQIEAVAGSNTPPYAFSTQSWGTKANGKRVELIVDNVTDDFAKVMQMKVVAGRFFNSEDDAAQYQPVVIDQTAAHDLFGNENAVGKKITFEKDEDSMKVVGVVESYRKDGEVQSPKSMVFSRYMPNGKFGGIIRNVMVRVRPGTPAVFEQTLLAKMQRVAPDMTFRVRHMDQMRDEALRFRLAPLITGAIVGMFLISMVALGLTGVLWQNVTKRTREIGLRRAMGASGKHVNRQILLEVMLLATIALIVGSIIILQLPILGAFAIVSPAAYSSGFALALATIYALTVLCGLYPSWLASRLQPADALRYE